MISMRFKSIFSALLFVLILFYSSCSQSSAVLERNSVQYFEEQIKAITTNYITIKNALVNNNPEIAAREARALRLYLEAIQLNRLDGKALAFWIDKEKRLRELLVALGTTESLRVQRQKFQGISTILIELVNEFGTSGLSLYKQHCPKALNGSGASWINEIEEIQNPYSGGLHCGKVVKKF
jgi:Cu(I)/Ag(I) efflux system membrane fusion protein